MKVETFTSILETLKTQREKEHQLYTLGVDLINLTEKYDEVISKLMEELWGKEGKEWVDWFMYENDFGKKEWREGEPGIGAYNENKDPICFDIPSLFEEIHNFHPQPYLEAITQVLKDATEEKLQTEVVLAALIHLKQNPGDTILQALEAAKIEWDI